MRDPLDLAVVAACITGALIGFLWWNTSPAQLFMGDTGSLALGGALAALAVFSRTELLLLFTGGLFVIVTGSVILQRAYFKVTRGKRIFLMSPLHHHFELKGWAEVTVVVRFWIIAGLLVRRRRRALLPRVAHPDGAVSAERIAGLTSWHADWRGLKVVVLGAGVTGFAAADTLVELGCDVLVAASAATDERRELLDVIGARLVTARPGRPGAPRSPRTSPTSSS